MRIGYMKNAFDKNTVGKANKHKMYEERKRETDKGSANEK